MHCCTVNYMQHLQQAVINTVQFVVQCQQWLAEDAAVSSQYSSACCDCNPVIQPAAAEECI